VCRNMDNPAIGRAGSAPRTPSIGRLISGAPMGEEDEGRWEMLGTERGESCEEHTGTELSDG
jgi:hypothetical protein